MFRFALIAILLLAACAPPAATTTGQLQVVTSTQIVGDVVSEIGGDAIQLSVLIPPQSDTHTFEAAPSDAALLRDASLIFVNGLNLEESLVPLLETVQLKVVSLSDGLPVLDPNVHVEEHEDEEEGHEHEGSDPHTWLNPQNVKTWADVIAAALSDADPENASVYAANASAYKAELDELDSWAVEQVALIPEPERMLVTDHEALGHFAHHYGFEIIGALIPSISTASEPTAGELAELQDTVREHRVKAIFVEANFNNSLAQRVAMDTGVTLVPLYIEALSESGGPAPTYLEMMRYNIAAIVDALK